MSVPEKFKDKELYKEIRKEVKKEYPKHSAYRSMMIVKKYKDRGGKIASDEKLEKSSDLERWIEEDWKNLSCIATGSCEYPKSQKEWESLNECGKKYPSQTQCKSSQCERVPTICRPVTRTTSATPKTAQYFNKKQIEKAQRLKNKGERVEWK